MTLLILFFAMFYLGQIFTSIMFCLDQNVYDMLYYIIYHFISHHLIISIYFFCLLLILLQFCSLHQCIFVYIDFWTGVTFISFWIHSFKLYTVFVWVHLNCYASHAWHLGLLYCSALPITKEWPVYSWIYGSEKSIARYRESPVGIFNFLSILWRLNPSKQRAMCSTKKF